MVDYDKESITTPRNQLCIKPWDGNMEDTTLIDLATLLKSKFFIYK